MRRTPARPGGGRLRGWFVADQPDFRGRGLWLLMAFASMAGVLGWRLADVQLRQHQKLAAMAAAQHVSTVALHGSRGHILDRSGHLLASNRPVYDVFADPGMIPESQRSDVAATLAPILQMGPGRIDELLTTTSRFVYLARGVSDDVRSRLAALPPLPGLGILPGEQRVYNASPLSGASFAANLLGFVDRDGTGQYGVEGFYDSTLRGQDGAQSSVRDLAGNSIVLSTSEQQPARDGRDIRLGIDSQMQYWAEQSLARGVANAEAESGQLLMMDTATGAIRAWAEYPSYDANSFASGNVANFRDLAIDGLYEPGSTMKVVTFAGGLDHHAFTPDYTFNEGPVSVDGYTIQDWDNRAHGMVTMQTVLEQSLNDGAIKAMELMGEDVFYQNLLTFGIGSPTGIDLAGEVNQPLAPQSQWQPSDFATTAFGQHVQATPIELLAAINAVANDGVWVQPHVAEAIIDPTTQREKPVVPMTRRVISVGTAHELAHLMTGVVDNHGGSGFLARIPGFRGQVAGKTGTASKPTNGRYVGDTDDSFVGFLPADHPQFTMLVLLRSPHTSRMQHEGAYLAAPVFKDLAQIAIDEWRIVP